MKSRAFLLILIIIIAGLMLCACGAEEEAAPAATPSPTPTATPEFLYASEFVAVKSDYALTPVFRTPDGFYAVGEECTGEDIPDEVIRLAEKEDEEVVNDGRYNVYETRLCFAENNGNVTLLDRYQSLPESYNAEGWKKFSSVSNFSALTLDAEGEIYTLEYLYNSGSSAPDKPEDWVEGEDYREFKTVWYLRHLRGDGKELEKREISLGEEAVLTGGSLVCCGDDFLVPGETGVFRISRKGVVLDSYELGSNVTGLVSLGDGRCGAVAVRDGEPFVCALDSDSGTYAELARLDPDYGTSVYDGTGEYTFLYSVGTNLYGFSSSSNVGKELFNWTGVNVNAARIAGRVYPLEDGYTFMMTDGRICRVTRTAYDPASEKTVLKLATLNPSYSLIDAVSAFNTGRNDVRIDIEDYSQYTGGETGEQAFRAYVDGHLGGHMPDILDMQSLPYSAMAASGLLENLYPYIDADAQIKRADFFNNVLVALEVDGGLYCTCSGFAIETVIGAAETVGDNPGWNLQKYYNALATMPEGCDGFDVTATRDDMLRTLLAMDLNRFIDWETLSCDFSGSEFKNMLAFAESFPVNFDYEHHGWTENDYADMRIRNGYQMLLPTVIYGFEDFMHAGFEFDTDVTCVGYPTEKGTGNMLSVVSLQDGGNLAMSAECLNKAAAWDFLRIFFTDDYQRKLDSFPSSVNVFNEKLSEAMEVTPILGKTTGKQLYDEDGNPRIYAVGTMYMSDFTPVSYYPLTDVQAAKLKELIRTTTKINDPNEDVWRIIKANLDAEDSASAIQAGVSEYLNTIKGSA